MEPSLDLFAILTILGVAQGILLALALLGLKQNNRIATWLLAAFLLANAANISGSLLNSTKYILVYPHLTQIATPFQFLLGPLIFLYFKTLASGQQRLGKKDILHFIPFCLCAAYYAPLYVQGREYKINYVLEALRDYPPAEWRIRVILLLAQFLPYMALTIRLFKKQTRAFKSNPSSAEAFKLFWFRTFLIIILVTIGVGFLRMFFSFTTGTMLVVPLCFTAMVYIAGYMALKHPDALTGASQPVALELVDEQPQIKKYEKSTLTPERADIYLKRLIEFMEKEKPYRDGDLTIQKLSEMLSVPVNYLSQIINEKLGQNFFDFVNGYRVKEVQKLLLDPAKSHYTIVAIAEEVGFRSKSAFNAVFKKHTNMTPTEFRKVASSQG